MQPEFTGSSGQETVQWRGLAAAIASISVVGIAIGLGMPLLSFVLEGRGFSAGMIGLNTAVAGLASLAAAPFATPLAVRFGMIPVVLVMLGVGGVSFAGFHFTDSFAGWFVLRATLHFAITVLFILSESWINHCAPPARRGARYLEMRRRRCRCSRRASSRRGTPSGRRAWRCVTRDGARARTPR